MSGTAQAPTAGEAWTPSERELERRAVRRRDRTRRGLLATAVSVVAFGLVAWVLLTSPGWPRVQALFFSRYHAWESFPDVARGFLLNVASFMVAEPVILLLGVLVAVTRWTVSPWLTPLRVIAIGYTDLFRGVPTLLVVFLLGLGVPALQLAGVTTNVFWLGTTALVLSYGAYVAEVVRAGIDSVHPSQLASAEALALTRAQTMRHVILPQALRRQGPPLLNDFVSLQKDTALLAVLGVFEALFRAQDYGNYNFNFTPLVVAAVFFLALTIPLARLTDHLGRRTMRRERGR
ncbi:amino acid ABC transporter permease [Nocardioides aurantiacus]|uniref:Amino acid ABC transporter membrane protein (PAAT family) n=1 Tax=Nocardioides aurantiacus TaxID=86796 RepID=A0A3N2CZ72_9ACTN|nr:amino acid ABC transporter permease [Nocardioides aurantiacus]ROR92841.1 amino acid ABC transporter membrane protein (PAAT family) [Nocardioides aurantiacus]